MVTKIEEFKSQLMHQDGFPAIVNANVKGDITPVDFIFEPAASEAFVVERLMIFGLGSTNVTGPTYIDQTITNGLTIQLHNAGGLIHDITENHPILSNDDLTSYCYDARQNLFAANPKSISARYTFSKDSGSGILFDGSKGDKLVITINDDLTGLVEHYLRVGCKQINL